MALDGTYGGLQASILDWLARPGDTLVSGAVPDMIALFEAEARDRLRTRFNEDASATVTTSAGVASVAVPQYFFGARELLLQGSPNVVLVYKTPEQMDDDDPYAELDQPEFYTVKGTSFYFDPVPSGTFTIAVDYIQGLPALSNASPSNWLLTNYPDVYLAGACSWAEIYIGHDERFATWMAAKESFFARILETDRKTRWSGEVLQIKTDTRNP